jgi:uncharacterized protein YggT (Ycf19 family)
MSIILLYTIVRTAVIVALAYAAVVAVTHWAVRNRRINPFGAWPRFVRRVSDPLLQPLERRVISAGGNPQNTPLSWLGIGPYRRWMRPVMALTNWLIDPIRRILPPFGMLDFSPMVAWLVLYVVRGFVMGLLL